MSRTHELKTWPDAFQATKVRDKRYELRQDDRAFLLGDVLRLREWSPSTKEYSGREMDVLVTHILRYDDELGRGLTPGYVIMGLGFPDEKTWP